MALARQTLFAATALAAVASLGVVACGEDPEPPPAPSPRRAPTRAEAPPPAGAAPRPLARAADLELPKADVRVLLTGSELGLLKPCGCSSPQKGGLERRAALWERLRGNAAAHAAVSLGDALFVRDDPRQNALKLELHAAALAALGYDGLLIGAAELVQGPQPVASPTECPHPPLNVKLKEGGAAAACASIDPILRFEKAGLRVRAVSVLDADALNGILESMGIADAVIPPQMALSALPKEPGLLIVAAHAYREDLAKIVAAVEGKADVVVVADVGGGTAYARPVPLAAVTRPLLVGFESKGQEAGILDLVRDGVAWKAAWRSVELDPSLEERPSALRDEVAHLFDVYRRRVREERLLDDFPAFPDEGGTFLGSAACASCHAAIYESWKRTSHAHALETLAAKDYERDPQCVRCHVVGWQRARDEQWSRFRSGFHTPEATPHLAGVGCETCHGPGSEHVRDPWKKDTWQPYRADTRVWRDIGRQGCQRCHDADNSPTFGARYEEHYRPKVDHREVPKELRTVVPK